MRQDELISVIVPVYNVEKYIDKCIKSIISQDYTNLEIWLVDDGSTDSSGEVCDKYAESDQRIIVIHKDNGGLSDARNVALDRMQGKYVLFIDSDDYIEKNYQNSELTLQVICHYLSMSPSYFSAILKKETGETFVELLTKKRMEKAKNLLRNTSLKNYEIAEKVGFSDSHYFSQTFKKYTGKTPKKYAQESRDEL